MFRNMKKYLYYIPFVLLAIPYLTNWYAWIVHDAELVGIVSWISIFAPYVNILLYIQWTQDILVWLAAIFYNGKFKPLLLIFTALWPIVPNVMKMFWTTPSPVEYDDIIFVLIMSIISYFSWKQLKKDK